MFSKLSRQFPVSRSQRRKVRRQFQIEGLEIRSLLSTTTAIPINFGATVASQPVAINSELVFAANDATHGTQLWESDGTSAGTVRLTDLNDSFGGIHPTDLTAVGNTLYFSATDGVDGQQLWKTDGTAAGTKMVSDSNDGVAGFGIYPSDLTAVNGTLYFQGYDLNDGYQLFKSDGTAAGTKMVADINGAAGSYPGDLTAVGGTLFFQASDAAHGQQLWSYNTTTGADDAADDGQRLQRRHHPGGADGRGQHAVLRRLRPGARLPVVEEQRDGRRDGDGDEHQRVERAGWRRAGWRRWAARCSSRGPTACTATSCGRATGPRAGRRC